MKVLIVIYIPYPNRTENKHESWCEYVHTTSGTLTIPQLTVIQRMHHLFDKLLAINLTHSKFYVFWCGGGGGGA